MNTISKKLFLAIGLFVLTAAITHAQDGKKKTSEERALNLSNKMKTELSLSDSQYTKVHAINLKYAEKNNEIMTSGEGRLEMFRALKVSNEAKNKELKAVLTKEQFKKYKEMQKEHKAEAKENFRNRDN